jgi:hypothetical protein
MGAIVLECGIENRTVGANGWPLAFLGALCWLELPTAGSTWSPRCGWNRSQRCCSAVVGLMGVGTRNRLQR